VRILTSDEMLAADRHAIDVLGIPSLALMECAGAEVVRAISDSQEELAALTALVLCGIGNNGGDGMVVARRLLGAGADVEVALLGDPARLSADAAHQWRVLEKMGIAQPPLDADGWASLAARLTDFDLVVDALLGTGFHGTLEGLMARAVEDLNAAQVPVISVDVPSGLSGSAASVDGPAVQATLTVTFQALKVCHVFAPAHERCGDVSVADIGIPEQSLDAAGFGLEMIEARQVAAVLEGLVDRPEDTHKGSNGHVLVVGGSVGRTGAPALSGLAALSIGAGLVTVATPTPCLASVAAHAPELMQIGLRATPAGATAEAAQDVKHLLEKKSVVAIGPGLGLGKGAAKLLRDLLESARVPIVLDADALTLVASNGLPGRNDERPLVLTPHPGEFERLAEAAGLVPGDNQLARVEAAEELAAQLHAVVILKGFRTLVAAPEGAVLVNPTGNPGMATAGTGDVLTGMVAGLLAQGLTPHEAAAAAVYVHGLAGDVAEQAVGQVSLRATDLIRQLPAAFSVLFPRDEAQR